MGFFFLLDLKADCLEGRKSGGDDGQGDGHDDLGADRGGSVALVARLARSAASGGVVNWIVLVGVLVAQAVVNGLDLELGRGCEGEDALGEVDGNLVEIVLEGDDSLVAGVGAVGGQGGGEGGDGSGQIGLGGVGVQVEVLRVVDIACPIVFCALEKGIGFDKKVNS